MEKRKISKKGIFIFISTICLIVYVCFYAARLVYYYLDENPIGKKEEKVVYLSNQVLKSLSLESGNDGLFFDEKTNEYYFKGKNVNNYLYYLGRTWRIVAVNSEGYIKLVSEESQKIMSLGENGTNIDDFIKNEFSSTLYNKNTYLSKNKVCKDNIDDSSKITCDKTEEEEFSLLSLYDYNRSGSANGFMNNDSYFWLSSKTTDDKKWYVFNKGGVNTEENKISKFYGVRVVITLKSKLNAIYGSGSYDSPYYIEDDKDGELKNRSIGEYLKYGGYTWRIIDQEEGKTKLIMDGYIKDGEEDLSMAFSLKKNVFDSSDTTGAYSYLNNTFYNKLVEENNYVKSSTFKNDTLNIENINFKDLGKDEIEVNVALPSIDDYFVSSYKNIFLINGSSEDEDLIYIINENGIVFLDNYTSKKFLRPVIYIDSSLYTLSNDGTKDNPYVIGS